MNGSEDDGKHSQCQEETFQKSHTDKPNDEQHMSEMELVVSIAVVCIFWARFVAVD